MRRISKDWYIFYKIVLLLLYVIRKYTLCFCKLFLSYYGVVYLFRELLGLELYILVLFFWRGTFLLQFCLDYLFKGISGLAALHWISNRLHFKFLWVKQTVSISKPLGIIICNNLFHRLNKLNKVVIIRLLILVYSWLYIYHWWLITMRIRNTGICNVNWV